MSRYDHARFGQKDLLFRKASLQSNLRNQPLGLLFTGNVSDTYCLSREMTPFSPSPAWDAGQLCRQTVKEDSRHALARRNGLCGVTQQAHELLNSIAVLPVHVQYP